MSDMEDVLSQFDIRAPAPGMVIYKRGWNGEKRTVGSEINPWDLAVATLPDLSTMISKTYVNEIDISKVRTGQEVMIGVDAFPEKEFTGEVIEVANIGEQLPNTDAKVFEVRIELNERDTILRPSMTTSNRIITKVLDDVLYLPLEAMHANDSLTFVYTKNRLKRVVVPGETNENAIIIEQGLKEGDVVYLSTPADPDLFKYEGLELMEIIKEREREKRRQQEQQQEEAIFAKKRPPTWTGQEKQCKQVMMGRYFHDIIIAIESILDNQLRSLLTALGIIFGVAAVITMLAIGKGAQQEILEQIKMVGVNNIMITPIVTVSESEGLRAMEKVRRRESFRPDCTSRMWTPSGRCCLH